MKARCKPRFDSPLREHYYLDCQHCGPVCIYCGHRPKRIRGEIPAGTCPTCLQELVNVNGKPLRTFPDLMVDGIGEILRRNGRGNNSGGPLEHLQKNLRLSNRAFAELLGITRWQLLQYKQGKRIRRDTIERIKARLTRRETGPGTSLPEDVSLGAVA